MDRRRHPPDRNLPDIEWSTGQILRNQYIKSISEEFLSFLEENAVQQMVTTPTRERNILDLFVTNRPSLLNQCEVIPGKSDHEVVLVDMNIEPHRNRPVKKSLHLEQSKYLSNEPTDESVLSRIFK